MANQEHHLQHILLQSFHGAFGHGLSHTQCLNPSLFFLSEYVDFSLVRFGTVSRFELSSSQCCPATFCVIASSGITACSSSKDGVFADSKVGGWDVEDEFVLRVSAGTK